MKYMRTERKHKKNKLYSIQLLTTCGPVSSPSENSSWPSCCITPSLYIGQDVLWYGISLCLVWVSYPGLAPSLLVHVLAGSMWEAEKTLT